MKNTVTYKFFPKDELPNKFLKHEDGRGIILQKN